MDKKTANNYDFKNFKLVIYSAFGFILIMLIIFNIIFIYNLNRYFLLIHNIIFVMILCLILLYLVKKMNICAYKSESFNSILIELINNFLNLINCFYLYYDETYLIIKGIYDDSKTVSEEDEIISELSLLLRTEIVENIKNVLKSLADHSNSHNKNGNLKILNEKLKSFNIEINNFLDVIEKSKKFIKTDLINRFEVYKNKNFFHEVVVEFNYYSEIISQFIIAFIENRRNLANSFSEQILIMRKHIKIFIDNIQKWKIEFFDKDSKLNFDKVIKYYERQNNQLNNFYGIIDQNNKNFDDKLHMIGKMIDKIFNNISSIEEISNKINILAINASIESARSDKEGKGFKIISSEIKSLANYTKSFITNIESIIKESNEIVKNTMNEFNETNRKLSNSINENKETLNVFYNNLNSYYNNFMSMFDSVVNLNSEINTHLDKFNVLIQHYDIEEQQMNNLMKVIEKFYKTNENDLNKIIDLMSKEEKENILIKIITFIEKIITTGIEAELVDNIKFKYGLIKEKKSHMEKNIELF